MGDATEAEVLARANNFINVYKMRTHFLEEDVVKPKPLPDAQLHLKNNASDNTSDNGSAASGAINGCLGFDELHDSSESQGAFEASPPPSLKAALWRPNSPAWFNGDGSEFQSTLCRSRSPSIGAPSMLDVFSDGDKLNELSLLTNEARCNTALLRKTQAISEKQPPAAQPSRKRPREDVDSPFDRVFDRPSMSLNTGLGEELDFERDVEDIVRLASNEGFSELCSANQFGSKQQPPVKSKLLSAMPYTFNTRPKETPAVSTTPAVKEPARMPKPNPYQLAYVLPNAPPPPPQNRQYPPPPLRPKLAARPPSSNYCMSSAKAGHMGSSGAGGVGMRYISPPSAIPIPPKAVVYKPPKRPVQVQHCSGGSGGSGAGGWHDAPGSNMLGRSLPTATDPVLAVFQEAGSHKQRRSKRNCD